MEIREVRTPEEARTARDVLDAVFRPAPGEPEISVDLLVAMAHTGQYVVVVHDEQGPLAMSLGFFAAPGERTLHSHVTAVLARGRGRGVGRSVKRHQRAWAIERGVRTVTWTYDPLVRRNAWFNLAVLGARPTAFVPRFYGEMHDGVNAGDESDRFVVAWDLHAPDGSPADPPGAPRVLAVGEAGEPRRSPLPAGAGVALAQVPPDIEAIRAADPALALRWRHALREVLTAGLTVTGMAPDGWYVLERR